MTLFDIGSGVCRQAGDFFHPRRSDKRKCPRCGQAASDNARGLERLRMSFFGKPASTFPGHARARLRMSRSSRFTWPIQDFVGWAKARPRGDFFPGTTQRRAHAERASRRRDAPRGHGAALFCGRDRPLWPAPLPTLPRRPLRQVSRNARRVRCRRRLERQHVLMRNHHGYPPDPDRQGPPRPHSQKSRGCGARLTARRTATNSIFW